MHFLMRTFEIERHPSSPVMGSELSKQATIGESIASFDGSEVNGAMRISAIIYGRNSSVLPKIRVGSLIGLSDLPLYYITKDLLFRFLKYQSASMSRRCTNTEAT